MKRLLVIAMILLSGCAAKHIPVTERVINIDAAKGQACVCPPTPVCEEVRGMRWRKM